MKNLENIIIQSFGNERYLSMQIDITNACNISCTHCYHPNHKNENALSLNQWFDVINQYQAILKKMFLKPHIIISGGEPLTSPLLMPILNYIKSNLENCHISVLTNGTLVSKYRISELAKFENLSFQVSIDGPDSDTHDSFRGYGNFQKAIDGIRLLLEHGYEVSTLATLTKFNCNRINDFFKLARDIKVSSMNFTRLIGTGTGKNLSLQEEHSITPSLLKTTFRQIIIASANYGVRTDTELPLMNLIHPSLGKRHLFSEGIAIDYQGNLLVSSRSRVKIGSVLNNNLYTLYFNSTQRKEFLNKNNYACSTCKHFNFCGGDLNASYAELGSFFEKDPGCWISEEIA